MMIEQAFEKARRDEWNAKTSNVGIVLYDKTPSKITVLQTQGDNGGWDNYHWSNNKNSDKDDKEEEEEQDTHVNNYSP
eukprot:5213708-Ditylum_brightwellii.AAC.1